MWQWISVKDRLPTNGVYLIAYNRWLEPYGSQVKMAYWFDHEEISGWHEYPGADDLHQEAVTYWAEIEQPPDSEMRGNEPHGEAGQPAG